MTKITKAVIPVAGWSTRFLPAVKSYAKHLVPVLNKPQIQLVMEELVGAGLTDFLVVHRDGENTIKDFFTRDIELDKYLESTGKSAYMDSYNSLMSKIKSIQFLPQTKNLPYGNGTPLLVAKDFIGNEPFVYLWGDDLTIEKNPGQFLTSAIDLFYKYQPSAVECATEVPWDQVPRYGVFEYAKNPKVPNQVAALIEKPEIKDAPSNIIQGGRFVVSPKIIPILQNTAIARGELWFSDAINYLAKNDLVITHNYTENNAKWTTTGDPLNWLKTNITLALSDPKLGPDIKQFLKSL